MPVKSIVALDLPSFLQEVNKRGLSIGAISGPRINSSGHYECWYDETEGENIIYPAEGRVGFSWAAGAIGTLEVMQKATAVPAEVVGAIGADGKASGTLANTYVLPGSVTLTDSGSVGPTLKDDSLGRLVLAGTQIQVGTINYGTGALSMQYLTRFGVGTGNLEADYSHSDIPDSADFPDRAILKSISLLAAANVDIAIYEDEALTIPVFVGTVTVSGGVGFLDLNRLTTVITETDLAKRNRRWVTVSVAVSDLRLYWERATS